MPHPPTFHQLDWQTWQLALDTYAKQLYDDERRTQSTREAADIPLNWVELPSGDRDVYRELALKLIEETKPRELK